MVVERMGVVVGRGWGWRDYDGGGGGMVEDGGGGGGETKMF